MYNTIRSPVRSRQFKMIKIYIFFPAWCCFCRTHRSGLRIVPAVGRRGSELLPCHPARWGELLSVHGDVELRAHLCRRVAPWMVPRSRHAQPSPTWSPAGSSHWHTQLYLLIDSSNNLLTYSFMVYPQITIILNYFFNSGLKGCAGCLFTCHVNVHLSKMHHSDLSYAYTS